jgi:hypothetical protein
VLFKKDNTQVVPKQMLVRPPRKKRKDSKILYEHLIYQLRITWITPAGRICRRIERICRVCSPYTPYFNFRPFWPAAFSSKCGRHTGKEICVVAEGEAGFQPGHDEVDAKVEERPCLVLVRGPPWRLSERISRGRRGGGGGHDGC